MHRALILVIPITIIGFATFSCREVPREVAVNPDDASSAALPSNLPLVEVMRGLESDLANVAHGIWTRDPEAVRVAAIRIAEHPKVAPEQVSIIRRELEREFVVFAQHDQVVHKTAVDLAAAVDSSSNLLGLFEIYRRIEQGCMSCHNAFQTRVSEALDETTTTHLRE